MWSLKKNNFLKKMCKWQIYLMNVGTMFFTYFYFSPINICCFTFLSQVFWRNYTISLGFRTLGISYLPMVSYFRYNIYVLHEWCSITLIFEIIAKYTSQLDMQEGLKYDNSSCYFQKDSIIKNKGDDNHKQKWFEIDCFIFLFY